jgi:hypothetical protein
MYDDRQALIDAVAALEMPTEAKANLMDELETARQLSPPAWQTAAAVALAKYPESRRIISKVTDPERMGIRGAWLGLSPIEQRFHDLLRDSSMPKALAEQVIEGNGDARELSRHELVLAVKMMREKGFPPEEIASRLQMSEHEVRALWFHGLSYPFA